MPLESYGPVIEEKVQSVLEQVYKSGKTEMSTADITRELGKSWVKIHFFIGHTKMTSK